MEKTLQFTTSKSNPCRLHIRDTKDKFNPYEILLDVPHPDFGDPKKCALQPTKNGQAYIRTIFGDFKVMPSENDYQSVLDFFGECRSLENEHRKHQVKIFLAVDYSSDYSSFHWIGDSRMPIEQIVDEATAQLMSHDISEADARRIAAEKVTEWAANRKAAREAREADEKRRSEILSKVRSVEIGRIRKSRGSDGDDLECPVTVVTLDGTVYRATFGNIFDSGPWSPSDWPAEVLAAAQENLPAEMREIRM